LNELFLERLRWPEVGQAIRVGCSEHHMGFPGTISLEKETFQAVCRDYCRSLARHGFKKLCPLPTHGGNFEPLVEVLPRIDEAQEGYHPESEEAIQRIIRDGLKSVTPNGILGDARGMSEAIGSKCIAALADVVARSFAD